MATTAGTALNNRKNAWQPVDDVGFGGSSRDLSNITNVNVGGAMSEERHVMKDIQHLKMDGNTAGKF